MKVFLHHIFKLPAYADLKFVATIGRVKFSNCINFFRKQRISLQNVCKNMKFTHLFGKITHTLTKKIMNTNALLSAKIAAIYVFFIV